MPVYTYRCDACGVEFDQQMSFSDAPLTICPECGQVALKKVYYPVGITFKGKGFYATDHKSPSGQKFTPGKKEEDGGNGKEKKEPVKAEEKPKEDKAKD